jgi:hypothetical protein
MQWDIRHPRIASLGAGITAALIIWTATGFLTRDVSTVSIPIQPNGAPPTPTKSPAEKMEIISSADAGIRDWIASWCGQSHDTAHIDRDQRQAADILKKLRTSNLDPSALMTIAVMLSSSNNAIDNNISQYFFEASMERVLVRLAARPASADERTKSIDMLWSSEYFQSGLGLWPIRLRVYEALMKLETPGSAREYRARLKHADILAMVGPPNEALAELRSISSDIDQGKYQETNPKDLAEVYWLAFRMAGRFAEGLDYLRAIVAKYRGTTDEQRLTGILIYATAQSGDVNDANRAFDQWLKTNQGTLSKPQIDSVRKGIRLGEQMARNAAATRASSRQN